MAFIIIVFTQAAIALITVFAGFQIPCHGPMFWLAVLTLFQGNDNDDDDDDDNDVPTFDFTSELRNIS